MSARAKKILNFSLLAIFIIGIVIALSYIDPKEFVERIGVRNGYLLTFFVSLFGGFSAGGSVSFISLLITLTAGGLNPIYLGLVSGIALVIGDIAIFYFGAKGRELVTGPLNQKIKNFSRHFEEKPWLKNLTPYLAYIYMGFTPFPNDILLLFLAAINYPRKKAFLVITAGSLTFPLTITLLASQ